MSASHHLELIDDILRREGGFVDHPEDRGGPTKYGITQATLADWRGETVSAEDVRDLTEAEAREIYLRLYVRDPRFDRIQHPRLRHLVVDCGVHHGPARAARWLQRAAGVTADGAVGPITLQAVAQASGGELYRQVLARRTRVIGRLITRKPSQAAFAAGWAARTAELIEETP